MLTVLQTCASYAGAFSQEGGGYLLNPTASTGCMYCPYTVGDQYLSTLSINFDERWRSFGLFLMFVFTNYLLVYFFIWWVRIKGRGFGFGYITAGFGKITGLFKKKKDKEQK